MTLRRTRSVKDEQFLNLTFLPRTRCLPDHGRSSGCLCLRALGVRSTTAQTYSRSALIKSTLPRMVSNLFLSATMTHAGDARYAPDRAVSIAAPPMQANRPEQRNHEGF